MESTTQQEPNRNQMSGAVIDNLAVLTVPEGQDVPVQVDESNSVQEDVQGREDVQDKILDSAEPMIGIEPTSPPPVAPQTQPLTTETQTQPLPLPPPTSQQTPAAMSAGVSGESPKRGRGRPKGSTKKKLLELKQVPVVVTAKRPVGRPRKDGLPAGAVGKFMSGNSLQYPSRQPFHSYSINPPLFTSTPGRPFSAPLLPPPVYYPPPIDVAAATDEKEDWVTLCTQNPNGFLASFIVALFSPNPTSIGGPTVEETFKSHLASFATNANQPQPAIPHLYGVLKTFWLPSSPTYFSLTASASIGRPPTEYRFFYWDPLPLVFNGIGCPHCGSPLTNKGPIRSGPIKIYDIDKPFFIIGCEYTCLSAQCLSTPSTSTASAESRRLASTDASIFRSLPKRLLDEFPARLVNGDNNKGVGPDVWNWTAQGVSLTLWNMVVGGLRAGVTKQGILAQIWAMRWGAPDDGGISETFKGDMVPDSVSGMSTAKGKEVQKEDDRMGDGVESEKEIGEGQQVESQSPLHNQPALAATDTSPKTWTSNSVSKAPEATSASVPTSTTQTPTGQVHGSFGTYPLAPYTYTPFQVIKGQAVTMAVAPQVWQQHSSTSASTNGHNSIQITSHPQPSPPTSAPSSSTHVFSSASTAFLPPSTGPNPPTNPIAAGVHRRAPRHCCKCGSQTCPGKAQRAYCKSACQDCGKLECKGRNSKKSDKTCAEGWD